MIERVLDKKTTDVCDNLLTKLIEDENKYNKSSSMNFVVKNYYNNVIKDKKNILLCFKENNIVKGYIFLKPTTIDNTKGYIIDALFVLEEYRNKGIGKKLIEKSISIANENEAKFLNINVLYNNEIAYKLYKSIGFNEHTIIMKYDIR